MSLSSAISDDDALAALERVADELFYAQGVVGVTMAAVRDTSGISLRRIYSVCPSKADLISLWLRYRHRTWTADFRGRVENNLAQGQEPVTAVFSALSAWMADANYRGCGFINTHAEASELTDEHKQIIKDHKASVARYLDEITGNGDAMAVLVDGAIVQAAMFSSDQPIRAAQGAAAALASGATPG